MILKISLIFSFLLSSTWAQDKNYCELNQNTVSEKVKINDFPSYFFKVHPDGKYIAYIGIGSNKLLNLETGNVIDLPGTIDPVFSPDGKYLLVPTGEDDRNAYHPDNLAAAKSGKLNSNEVEEDEDGNFSAMTYYEFDKFIELEQKESPSNEELHEAYSNPAFVDEESSGVYQSSSLPNKEDGNFKIITDENGVSYRDVNNDNLSQNSDIKLPCSNISNFPTDLPMLSKDGKYMSVYNSETQSTQIYNIEDTENCNLSTDLGIATGKVAFNFDSSQITFHVDHFSDEYGEYFSGVPSDVNKDVYVMNLDEASENGKKVLKPSSWAKVTNNAVGGNGAYYPNFDKNGDLYFLNDENNYFEFNKVEQDKLVFENYTPYPNIQLNSDVEGIDDSSKCYVLEKPIQDQVVLGQMWSRICKEMSPSYQDSLLISMGLNQKNCQEMVLENWNSTLAEEISNTLKTKIDVSEILNYSLNDLLAACPSNQNSSETAKVIGEWIERDHRGFQDVITQKCVACHTNPMTITKDVVVREYVDENDNVVKEETISKTETLPAFDVNNIDAKMIMKMMMAVGNEDPSSRMPPGGSLRREEMEMFMAYFQELTFGMASDEDPYADVYDYNLTGSLYSQAGLEQMFQEEIDNNNDYYNQFNAEEREQLLAKEKERIWCEYGQKGCDNYLKRYEEDLVQYYSQDGELSREARSNVVRDVKLKKCEIVYQVTYDECNKLWEETYSSM